MAGLSIQLCGYQAGAIERPRAIAGLCMDRTTTGLLIQSWTLWPALSQDDQESPERGNAQDEGWTESPGGDVNGLTGCTY
jgi:hypothetical protein